MRRRMCDLTIPWEFLLFGAVFLQFVILAAGWWADRLLNQLAYQRNIIYAYEKEEEARG